MLFVLFCFIHRHLCSLIPIQANKYLLGHPPSKVHCKALHMSRMIKMVSVSFQTSRVDNKEEEEEETTGIMETHYV